jgi:hypothetical protein
MLENPNQQVPVQPQSSQITPDLATPSPSKPPYLPLGLVVVVLLIAFGAGGYYLGSQSANNSQQVIQPQTNNSPNTQDSISQQPTSPTTPPQGSNSSSPSPELKTKWQSYTNQAALYKVEYPEGWRVVSYNNGEGYGPMEIQEDTLWGINIYDKNTHSISKIANDVGSQFSDKKQAQDSIVVNGLPATKITTTTPSIPDWYSETIVIERGSSYIAISNGAIANDALQKMRGVPAGTTFERFYNSFVFVN